MASRSGPPATGTRPAEIGSTEVAESARAHNVARAIILRPRLLILDEPTSALDVTIQKQVLDLLRGLQTRYNLTYIFITHDLRTVRSLADQVAVMRHGRIVESGPAATVFADPQDDYTRRLFHAAFHRTDSLEEA